VSAEEVEAEAEAPAMKITRVEAIPFDLPVSSPLVFATGAVNAVHHVLIRIHTDEGIVGESEAAPRIMTYGDTQSTVVSVVEQVIEPMLAGADPLAIERVGARLGTMAGNHCARAAVDLALHDLRGKFLGQPCHRLLGGYADDVAVSYMLSFGDPDEVAESAAAVNADYGVTAFKIKVGAGLAQDVRTCRNVRRAVGDSAVLYIDANHGYGAEEAVRLLGTVSDLGIAWFEEPSPAAAAAAARRLAANSPIPIAGDERCRTVSETAAEIRAESISRVSIKTARTGFSESGRILAMVGGLGVPAAVGSQFETGLGVLSSVSFAAAVPETAGNPVEATSFLDLADDILINRPTIRNGRMSPPGLPGIGAQIDEDKLRYFAVRRSG
jgi:L-alanine-DL-glutamate epimerase-like enolase superfamily enzyme